MIEFSQTANQWELFDMAGAEEAARHMNRKLNELVRERKSSKAVMAEMHKLQDSYSDLGAADTEPRWHLMNYVRKLVKAGLLFDDYGFDCS